MKKWQLQDAKNRFSQVAEEAASDGPQVVTKHGKDAVVILSMEEYQQLKKPKESLVKFLQGSPLKGVKLDIDRERSEGRAVDL